MFHTRTCSTQEHVPHENMFHTRTRVESAPSPFILTHLHTHTRSEREQKRELRDVERTVYRRDILHRHTCVPIHCYYTDAHVCLYTVLCIYLDLVQDDGYREDSV